MSGLRWYGYFYEFLLNFTDGKGKKDSPKHITFAYASGKEGNKIKG